MDNLIKYLFIFALGGTIIVAGFGLWVEVRETETLEKGKPVTAVIVDKVDDRNPSVVGGAGTAPFVVGGLESYVLRMYVGEKIKDIPVSEAKFDQVKVGDKIDVVEYKDRVVLKK